VTVPSCAERFGDKLFYLSSVNQKRIIQEMASRSRMLLVVSLLALALPTASLATKAQRVCWPGFTIPAVTIPAVTIPAVTIRAVTVPGFCFGGTCYPAQHLPAQHLPAQRLPAQHLPAQHVSGACFDSSYAPAPAQTTVRVRNYKAIDPMYSPQLSTSYWAGAGAAASYPDVAAPGFGELNAAGFPKNQYVRPYLRRDGTYVSGYWRNSPTDGLPTCTIIRC
jgi:hypothetical protein